MAINGQVTIAWGDGDHTFNIAKIAQIFELEDKCGCGVMEVMNRLREVRWKLNDVREPIRLGLIGAGLSPPEASILVKRYVDDRPLAESVIAAQVIVMAALFGVIGDQPGKKPGADRAKDSGSTTTTAGSSDPQSTGSGQGLDGGPGKPGERPSGRLPPASTDTIAPTALTKNPTSMQPSLTPSSSEASS